MLHLIVWRLSIRNFPDRAWSPLTRIVWNGGDLCERNKDLSFSTEDPQAFPWNGTHAPPSNGIQASPSNGTQETLSSNTQAPPSNGGTQEAPLSKGHSPHRYNIEHPPPYVWLPDLESSERLQPFPPELMSNHATQMQPSSSFNTQGPGHNMQSPMSTAYPNTIGLLITALKNGSVAHLGKNV